MRSALVLSLSFSVCRSCHQAHTAKHPHAHTHIERERDFVSDSVQKLRLLLLVLLPNVEKQKSTVSWTQELASAAHALLPHSAKPTHRTTNCRIADCRKVSARYTPNHAVRLVRSTRRNKNKKKTQTKLTEARVQKCFKINAKFWKLKRESREKRKTKTRQPNGRDTCVLKLISNAPWSQPNRTCHINNKAYKIHCEKHPNKGATRLTKSIPMLSCLAPSSTRFGQEDNIIQQSMPSSTAFSMQCKCPASIPHPRDQIPDRIFRPVGWLIASHKLSRNLLCIISAMQLNFVWVCATASASVCLLFMTRCVFVPVQFIQLLQSAPKAPLTVNASSIPLTRRHFASTVSIAVWSP